MKSFIKICIEYWYASIPCILACLSIIWMLLQHWYFTQKYTKGSGKLTPEYTTEKPMMLPKLCSHLIGSKGTHYKYARFHSVITTPVEGEPKKFTYKYIVEYW